MEETDFVEVLDLTFFVAVPGLNGEPAKLHYTVRAHLGDGFNEAPGALTIQFAPKDMPGGGRIAGRKVTIATGQLVGLERDTRLEKRTRQSIASLIDPQHDLKLRLAALPVDGSTITIAMS